jgi:pantoate--beta-alanine ligase
MLSVNNIADVRQQVGSWRSQGERIAFVPTMGNLHAGHLALVEQAKELADHVVVSIFVNPIQFGLNEDFDHYPRTLTEDSEKLVGAGIALLFAPSVEEMYPEGYKIATRIDVAGVSEGLCAEQRPGHFTGVATVVSKLFNIVQPDVALFGEKDYQQLQVIRRMVTDLCFPIEIVGVEIRREANGLAMSSRNSYLSVAEQAKAACLHQVLQAAVKRIQLGCSDFRQIEVQAMERLKNEGVEPEYFAIRQAETLLPAQFGEADLRLLVAAWLGKIRLIDNLGLFLIK